MTDIRDKVRPKGKKDRGKERRKERKKKEEVAVADDVEWKTSSAHDRVIITAVL